ncbi:MAG: hypothetical protein E7271_09565 [Lachnospiraceae bacterium]|jgi:DNA topoisomerase IA|nr:hypothetical protein [Lachnospiraceae bacterium]
MSVKTDPKHCVFNEFTANGTSVSDMGWKEYDEAIKKYVKASLDKEKDDDVERKGIGTPATRAEVIEKLVTNGYVIWSRI